MAEILKIDTPSAPKAIGPYSQGITTSADATLIFVSGQLPIDPKNGKIIEGDMKMMTSQVIDNIESILIAGGSGLEYVVKVEVFLKDLKNDFQVMNEVYSKRFAAARPARQTIQVVELPLGSPIEISCVAVKNFNKN